MHDRKSSQQQYAEALTLRAELQRSMAVVEDLVRSLERNYPELIGLPGPQLLGMQRGRYREIFEGDRRLAIADAILRRGGRARDLELILELEREDLVIPTREKDPEKRRIVYLKRVRQSLSGNPKWFKLVAEGTTDKHEEWYEYETTELARKKTKEHFEE